MNGFEVIRQIHLWGSGIDLVNVYNEYHIPFTIRQSCTWFTQNITMYNSPQRKYGVIKQNNGVLLMYISTNCKSFVAKTQWSPKFKYRSKLLFAEHFFNQNKKMQKKQKINEYIWTF